MKSNDVFCTGLLLVLLFSTRQTVLSQKSELSGRITNSSGGVVAGARVSLTEVDTGFKRSETSNEEGYYSFPHLQGGNYQIVVEMRGYRTIERSGIQLGYQEAVRVDFVLEVGEVSHVINVTEGIPLIETGASNFSVSLDARYAEHLSLLGREIENLAQLIPGVVHSFGPPGAIVGFKGGFGSFPDPTHMIRSLVAINVGGYRPSPTAHSTRSCAKSASSLVASPTTRPTRGICNSV